MESICEEYLTCLFLLLVDKERFKHVTTELSNNYLLGNQEYPANILAAKRIMTNFDYSNVGKPTSSVKQQDQVQPTDIAFVEKRKWEDGPICYYCGERNKGGWQEFLKVSNKEKLKTADMVGSGNFDPRTGKKWDNTHKTATPKAKKGVVQAAVEEDSERNYKGEETVLPYYDQLLKANGFINISVHGDVKRKDSRNFDGDAVSEFDIGCLQIDDA